MDEFVKPYDPDYDKQALNTEGAVAIGEINTRAMREAIVEPDHREAMATAAANAYADIIGWAQERIDRAGPYDDTRALQELILILGDKIRDVRSKATVGDQSA